MRDTEKFAVSYQGLHNNKLYVKYKALLAHKTNKVFQKFPLIKLARFWLYFSKSLLWDLNRKHDSTYSKACSSKR